MSHKYIQLTGDLAEGISNNNSVTEDQTDESVSLPAWHRPAITRVDIKRTMVAPGSGADGGQVTL